MAEGQLKPEKDSLIEYESNHHFRNSLLQIVSTAPTKLDIVFLKASWIDSPLGPILAISDEQSLYLLEFAERRGLPQEIERLREKTKSAIVPGRSEPIESIQQELSRYFAGELKEFKTPLVLFGSPFQKRVWEELRKIPYGETRSYSEIAKAIGHPPARRAVARANGTNQIAIAIPCHRVINANGELGGYGGGIPQKQWMIEHERKCR